MEGDQDKSTRLSPSNDKEKATSRSAGDDRKPNFSNSSSTGIPSRSKSASETKSKAVPAKRGRKPREKDMPKRPLSAYNLFFKDERQRILADLERGHLPEDYRANAALALKDGVDGKRVGAAKFQAIARTIAVRWKALSEEDRKPLEKMAEQEMKDYKVKKEEYNRKVAREAQMKSSSAAEHDEPSFSDADGSLEKISLKSAPKASATPSKKEPKVDTKPKSRESPTRTSLPGIFTAGVPGGLGTAFLMGGSMAETLSPPQPHHGLGSASAGMPGTESGWNTRLQLQQPSRAAFSASGNLAREGDYGFLLSMQAEELRRREQALLMAEQRQQERQMRDMLLLQLQQVQGMMLPREEQQLRARLLLQEQERVALQEHQLRMQLLMQQQQQQQVLPNIEQQLRQQQLQSTLLLQQQRSANLAQQELSSQLVSSLASAGSPVVNLELLSGLPEEERKSWVEKLSQKKSP